MRYFTVELTPTPDNGGWEVYAGALPLVQHAAQTGAHEDGFFIAPETMPVGEAFEVLRRDLLERLTNQIAQLTESALALVQMQPPQFAPIEWGESTEAAEAAAA